MPILTTATDSREFLRMFVSVLFICAIAGLVLTGVFGFEEPNDSLLLLSSSLLFVAVAAVLVHLGVTGALTRTQKRVWLARLTGRGAASAWGEYLTCDDLRAAANRFSEDGASYGRRGSKHRDSGEGH